MPCMQQPQQVLPGEVQQHALPFDQVQEGGLDLPQARLPQSQLRQADDVREVLRSEAVGCMSSGVVAFWSISVVLVSSCSGAQ